MLLLYRRGSRAIADSWVGIGGHLEPGELTNPTAAALRELKEEIGVTADHLTDLAEPSIRRTADRRSSSSSARSAPN